MEAFLENQRQQPTFLWETTTLKTSKHRALSYALRTIYSLWQCGGWWKSLYGQGHSCGACMTHFITVYTQRSFLILQCQLPQLFSVSCLFRYSSFNIFPSFAIYISCTVVLCKHLFIVDAGDGFLPRKGTGLRWLISSYQTIHAVRLFYSLHDLLSPPSVQYAMQFVFYVSSFERFLLDCSC